MKAFPLDRMTRKKSKNNALFFTSNLLDISINVTIWSQNNKWEYINTPEKLSTLG